MEQILSAIKKISLRYKIEKVILFGSRARGDYDEKSDYDIAFVHTNMPIQVQNKIKDEIDQLDTLHKIDLVFLVNLLGEDKLVKNIKKEGITLMDRFTIKLHNYKNAFERLQQAIDDFQELQKLSVRDGAIQRFEFTTELAWKTIREFLLGEQVMNINTPKAVMREAFSNNLITDEEGWITILNDRNATSHLYDEAKADEIFVRICTKHIFLFEELLHQLIDKDI